MISIFLLLLHLALLILGSEWLVRFSTQLGLKLRISPLLIGLTFVAFGSSAPEIAISIQSSLSGFGMIAVSNIVGSNMFNILIILGISGFFKGVRIPRKVLFYDLPIMITASLLFFVLTRDGMLTFSDGLIIAGFLTLYLIYLFLEFKKTPEKATESLSIVSKGSSSNLVIAIMMLVSISLILWSSKEIVSHIVLIAEWLGINHSIMGLTLIAIGTSLPEFATSIISMLRGQNDTAVGNIIGSNTLNILVVIGLTSLISLEPIALRENLIRFDIPVMFIVALMCFPAFFTDRNINTWEGVLFLSYYISYMAIRLIIALDVTDFLWLEKLFIHYLIPITLVVLCAHSALFIISWKKK